MNRFAMMGERGEPMAAPTNKYLKGRNVTGFHSSCCVFCSPNGLPFFRVIHNEL